jgi:hypothetical protein
VIFLQLGALGGQGGDLVLQIVQLSFDILLDCFLCLEWRGRGVGGSGQGKERRRRRRRSKQARKERDEEKGGREEKESKEEKQKEKKEEKEGEEGGELIRTCGSLLSKLLESISTNFRARSRFSCDAKKRRGEERREKV